MTKATNVVLLIGIEPPPVGPGSWEPVRHTQGTRKRNPHRRDTSAQTFLVSDSWQAHPEVVRGWITYGLFRVR
jgi:hypothetical protein